MVWLHDVQIRGDRSLIFSSDGLFVNSTVGKDREFSVVPDRPHTFAQCGSRMKYATNRRYANYYHWTFQCVSALLDMKSQGLDMKGFILPPLNGWRRELLEPIEVDIEQCFQMDRHSNVRCEGLLYSSYSSAAFTYAPPPRLIELFESFSDSLQAENMDDYPERIYLSREGAEKRAIENEEDMARCAAEYGFVTLRTENMSVLEQIRIFSNVRHVIAPHGAGLANLLYSRRCMSVSEIFQPHYVNSCMYQICNAKGIRHFTLSAPVTHEGGRHRSRSSMEMPVFESHLARQFAAS